MANIYLWFNALTYAVFAVWCTIRPTATAEALGYTSLSASGQSEYLTVYGGLQWGLALTFALFAAKPELRRTGMLVAILLYAPLVLHRLVSLLVHGPVETLTYAIAILEAAMLAAAVAIWLSLRQRQGS